MNKDALENQVQLSKGIKLSEILTSDTEFHIDIDFQKKKVGEFLNGDDDYFPDMGDNDDSDSEDVLKQIEESTEKMMLSSPEYDSFERLSEKMADCVSGGLVKILIIEEDEGPLIPVDAQVTLHYAAYWEKAKIPFDSSLTTSYGSPMRIDLGRGKFLPGLELALTMVRGKTSRFHVLLHPKYAWGENGVPPRIKPEPCLLVVVVYDVKDVQAAARFNDLPSEEQKKFEVTQKTVKTLRVDAKDLYNNKKYKRAINTYQQAITVLSLCNPQTKQEEDEIKEMKIKVYVNLLVCFYKINKPKSIFNICKNIDKIIDIETHCKALFYYGKAHEMLNKIDLAMSYYKKALKLEPNNKDLGKVLAELDAKLQKSAVNERAMWQKAFKNESKKETIEYDVDDDFQNGVREMCQDLAGRDEYSRFDLPLSLSSGEVECIKDLASKFEGLTVQEDWEGTKKKVTIIKKVSS